MKLKEIFDVDADQLGISYYKSSFLGKNDVEGEREKDVRTQMYIPQHVNIDPQTTVNLVKNDEVVKTDTWKNMVEFLKSSWDELQGLYKITDSSAVLHRFHIV